MNKKASPLKPVGVEKKITEEKLKAFERNLEKESEIYHDLFRLDDAITVKNVSYIEDQPKWVELPHRHFYHTVTSDGKSLDNSAPSAGHFHPVIMEKNEAGEVVSVKCGDPMVIHKGKSHPYKNDKHTHEVSYLTSEMVTKRTTNRDAIKVMQDMKSEENQAENAARGIYR